MADNEPDKAEKTEPRPCREARRKGSVAKSVEVNTFLAVCAGVLFLITTGRIFIENTLVLCSRLFASAGQISFETRSLVDLAGVWSGDGVAIMAPLVALVMVVAIIGTFVQIGPVFSFFPLKPDIKRLNREDLSEFFPKSCCTNFSNHWSRWHVWAFLHPRATSTHAGALCHPQATYRNPKWQSPFFHCKVCLFAAVDLSTPVGITKICG